MTVEQAFVAACRAELASLKPGNVHAFAPGHRMDTAMFEASALAAAPEIARSHASVGARVEGAVTASVKAAGCNTNLGIVLLCAPLACASERRHGPLRVDLADVLAELTVDDARAAYRAIAAANPAGLGTVTTGDVAAVPAITLREAMNLARSLDRIANAYVTDFADVFEFSLPALHAAHQSADTPELAVTTLHMCLLAHFPDTHIARKFGMKTAHDVQAEAHQLAMVYLPAVSKNGFSRLLEFDADLKSRGLNPGTTADFVVATLFAERLLTANRPGKLVSSPLPEG
jgi:triphosphoribosyl-dephospho-CoA synthase